MKPWIKKGSQHPGALHRQLGYSTSKELPEGLLHDIYKTPVGNMCRGRKVTTLLKRRVVFAVNAQKGR